MLRSVEQSLGLRAPIVEIVAHEAGVLLGLVDDGDARIAGERLGETLRQHAGLAIADDRDEEARRRLFRAGAPGVAGPEGPPGLDGAVATGLGLGRWTGRGL